MQADGQIVDNLVVETLVGGVWAPTGLSCPQPAPALSIPVLVAAAVRLVPAVSMGSAPPATGTPVVGVQTILWLTGGDGYRVLPSATLLGHRVEFRARVTGASWVFGDGDRAESVGAGVAYDVVANPCRTRQCAGYFGHTYTVSGQMRVVATPRWSGQARVDGGLWQELGDGHRSADRVGVARVVGAVGPRPALAIGSDGVVQYIGKHSLYVGAGYPQLM